MTTIVIDEKSETGKGLMVIIKAIQKTSKSVKIVSDEDIEDALLGKIMQEVETGEYVSREEIMKELGR